jgi:hypothetical protein
MNPPADASRSTAIARSLAHAPHTARTGGKRASATFGRVLDPLLAGFVGSACALGGAFAAAHHPLSPTVALALFVAVALVSLRWPHAWLAFVPALLPVVDLAPWSGWLTFEEFDLLVLAAACGNYWHRAVLRPRAPAETRPTDSNSLAWLGITAFGVSLAVALIRGFADAGGFVFGWYQGLHESMNSVRIGKAFALAWLLLPMWLRACSARSRAWAASMLSIGLASGLCAASLAALWERLAFPGLLDFSSDYRTTALFWEMHVGGAALDGFVALTMPFAIHRLWTARTRVGWSLALALLLLSGYACLTTFSRGVYLAIPVGLAATAVLAALARRRRADGAAPAAAFGTATLAIGGFALAAAWMFPTSGYRGMLALLGVVTLLLALGQRLRSLAGPQLAVGAGVGLLLLGPIGWSAGFDKGAYLAYAAAFALAVVALACLRSSRLVWLAVSGFMGALAGLPLVAGHWGGEPALWRAVPPALILAGIAVASMRVPLWPARRRWQGGVAAAMAVAAALVGITLGGAYMSGRFGQGEADLLGRLERWRSGLSLLSSPADPWLGKGLGRFPANQWLDGKVEDTPGDYRWRGEGAGGHLVMSGGKHMLGWGELLRISQRIAPPPPGPLQLSLEVRADEAAALQVEVCEKHLLYNAACMTAPVRAEAAPGAWQGRQVLLTGAPVTRGPWYAPRLIAFSIAVDAEGKVVNVRNLRLSVGEGPNLLANGDFSQGMAHWFFTSDRHHLPWHIKNLFLAVLFDQGWVGLTLFALLVAGALWRVSFGLGRDDLLAPPIAGALLGFCIVGLFDSLVDAPRIAVLFYLLVMVALTLQPGRPRALRPGAGPGWQPIAGSVAPVVLACLVLCLAAPAAAQSEPAQRLRVGGDAGLKTIAEAALLARNGATIEVQAGDYAGDVAVWTQDDIVLRAVGGPVRLLADGAAAEGKAIWVVRGHNVTVEGFDFQGARVAGRNGAGIRFEHGSLRVRDCSFVDNEMGLMTSNDPQASLRVEDSEFARNRRPDGHNHNLYVGSIARFEISGSYLHHATTGHLLKSRAAFNRVSYNRLTDEDGTASYELEFPNGGTAIVVGNIIEQGRGTENPQLVSFGAEGYTHARNELFLVHNTLVDGAPRGGEFVHVWPGASRLVAIDNLVVGPGAFLPDAAEIHHNRRVGFSDLSGYRLRRAAEAADDVADAGSADGELLAPTREYAHPRHSVALSGPARYPGALRPVTP